MQPDRPLNYYMQKLFRQLDMGEFASEMEVQKTYRYLAGDLIYKLTTLCAYRDGTLRLRFAAAALRQEMTWRRETLRQRMNDELKGNVIKKIVIL